MCSPDSFQYRLLAKLELPSQLPPNKAEPARPQPTRTTRHSRVAANDAGAPPAPAAARTTRHSRVTAPPTPEVIVQAVNNLVQPHLAAGTLAKMSVKKIIGELAAQIGAEAGRDYDKAWLRGHVDKLIAV